MGFRLFRTKGVVRREAHSWFVRLRGPNAGELQELFRRWYEADRAHAEAFDSVSRHFAKSGVASQSAFGRSRSLERPTTAAAGQARYALAAAIALIVLVPTAIILRNSGIGPFGQPNVLLLATSLGQIRQVDLADGSRVTLDTGTAVRVELKSSLRRAVVKQGRVRFSVAPDSRPFVVETDAATFTTRDAVMDVERANGQSRIEILSGTASVSGGGVDQGADNAPLGKGDALSTSGRSTIERYRASVTQPDWTRGMLQFNGTPLPEAVARANRYSNQKIVLSGGLGDLRVTGAYMAGDIAGFARSLGAAFRLNVHRTASGEFLLVPDAAAPAEKKKGR